MLNRFFFAVALILCSSPAWAITGGRPDGDAHPYGALILVPGETFCSGVLIDEDVVLTVGHCTDYFENNGFTELWVTFDSTAAVDPETFLPIPGQGTWHVTGNYATYPGFEITDWPIEPDFGVILLEEPVAGIIPAQLPEPDLLESLIDTNGQTALRFNIVGYGQAGVTVGGGPPVGIPPFYRKVSTQRYHPRLGGLENIAFDFWFVLHAAPSPNHGGACTGDSGSGVFIENSGPLANTVVALMTGGESHGFDGWICGMNNNLTMRIDRPYVLAWLAQFLD